MPSPFLSLFPATARQAYPFIQAGVSRGLSSRAIEQTIRGAGLSISRARSILPIMRELQKIQAYGLAIRNIGKDRAIGVDRLPESLTRLRRQFSYTVRVQGRDSFGNLIDRYVTVATDKRTLTPGQIEAAAEGMVGATGQSGHVMDVRATLQSGARQAERFDAL